jgi:rhamnulokinase
MSHFYVACDFGQDSGLVSLGALDGEKLSLSEIRRFSTTPLEQKGAYVWNVQEVYRETLKGLQSIGSYDEIVSGISCSADAADYMLFDRHGELVGPAYHHRDPRGQDGARKISKRISPELLYQATGIKAAAKTTLSQLGGEKALRLEQAAHLLPVADAFNFLLAGVARVEMSSASATQIFDPVKQMWSEEVVRNTRLPERLLPEIVAAGTELGALRREIGESTGLEGSRVLASCSHELAAALVALPVKPQENWAFLKTGGNGTMGTDLPFPLAHEGSYAHGFDNELGYDGSIRFSKSVPGLELLDACHDFWAREERAIEKNLLIHMAISAPALECLIDPADPRFASPENMPEKIQQFCRETNQPIPRKHGHIARCVLESLALHYRRVLDEINELTSSCVETLYFMGDSSNSLLNHFTANALQVPVVIAPDNCTAIGNIMVQAIALGHVSSLTEAREIVGKSFKTQTIVPHAKVWEAAYRRLERIAGK